MMTENHDSGPAGSPDGAATGPEPTLPWYDQVTHPGSGTAVTATQPIPQPAVGTPADLTTSDPVEPPQPSRTRRLAELTAVAALAALLASGGTYAATRAESSGPRNPSPAAPSSSPGRSPAVSDSSGVGTTSWAATAAAVTPSVVAIGVTTNQGEAQGSGVVLDATGHVLTNNHVVSGAAKVRVSLSDGRTYSAQIKGTDPSTDLAVVTISKPPPDLQPIAMGDSDALKVGDPVMAVGNPLGLAGTVTTGIVSALNRPVTTSASDQNDPFGSQQSSSTRVVTNAIQTSAAINPGNSGGALVNSTGALVGINSSIASLSSGGSQSGNIGIGFAIPVREAQAIADQLIATGRAQHAYLGVSVRDGTATDGDAQISGALIGQIESGTPAATAGLKTGDVVIAVDGEQIVSGDAFIGSVRERLVGDTVKITVVRDGKRVEVETKLVTRPTATN
ncbi:MAG: S1C family serine protease [Nostocoides sp.]